MDARVFEWVPPERFDEYRLVKVLGRGGMGQVWLAHDAVLDRLVAVKFIAGLHAHETVRRRFLTEARAAARVQHPNIIAVYRVGELGPRPYLISEYVRGETLDKLARPVAWPRLLELARGLARGLAAAHRRGVLHRDLKPANAILAETGEVKLLDFGLAKLLEQVAVAIDERPERMPEYPGEPTLPMRPAEASPVVVAEAARADDPEPVLALPGVTVAGAVMGTPSYMAPEQWRGEPATPRSDVYSLGALLFELAAGAPPHTGDELRARVLETDARPLAGEAPGLDARFAAIVDRCLRRAPAERFASGEAVRDALEALAAGALEGAPLEGNPYRGLAAFEARHRRLFFGRDGAIRTVLDRLAVDPFVLVAGDSGVGKSSLCRAGVLPRVEEGALGERRLEVIALVPGRRPAAGLAVALAPLLGTEERAVHAAMIDDADELVSRLRARLGERGLVVFVDQLEELVTLADAGEAATAARMLAALVVRSPQLRVLATVRGDYLTRLASLPPLAPELERALVLLAPLGAEALREAVLGPARAAGVRFESEALVDELVAAAVGGGLPLLQFALGELWEARDRGTAGITAASLVALGGVTGALGRHADATLAVMPAGPRAAARDVVLGLVTAQRTRARRTAAELATTSDARAAIETLVRARLVVARADAYELVHEALIAEWATLRGWLHEDDDARVLRQHLARAAADWIAQGRPRDALWPARRLAAAADLEPASLDDDARLFVRRSRSAVRRRRAATIAAVAAVPLIAVAVYLLALRGERTAREQRIAGSLETGTAALEHARALQRDLAPVRAAALARFDAGDYPAGKEAWRTVHARSAEVDRAFGAAGQALEQALALDGARADVRGVLADVLLERALFAEARQADPEQIEELLGRLSLYDDSGERRRRWRAPATIELITDPPTAAVALERWGEGRGWEPAQRGALEPGSYRFQLRAPGRAEVAYPVRVQRGERLALTVALPPRAAVPEGFAYLPPARFLSGTTQIHDIWTSYLNAAPIHERTSRPVLMAIHETTYAEWIGFLETRDAIARAVLTPSTTSTSMQGSLRLERSTAGTWSLHLQPGPQPYKAAAGTPITYLDRTRDAVQIWEHMPVSGISWSNAVSYAGWLDRTGRVPRARLCRDAEWELAARGADGRRYPTGAELAPAAANLKETHGSQAAAYGPDAVGTHPASASPFGIQDLAGNVWEMTGIEGDQVIARGGAFSIDLISAQADLRQEIEPTLRDPTMGFRICADL